MLIHEFAARLAAVVRQDKNGEWRRREILKLKAETLRNISKFVGREVADKDLVSFGSAPPFEAKFPPLMQTYVRVARGCTHCQLYLWRDDVCQALILDVASCASEETKVSEQRRRRTAGQKNSAAARAQKTDETVLDAANSMCFNSSKHSVQQLATRAGLPRTTTYDSRGRLRKAGKLK